MHIAIVTFDGFNELDSLVSASILNRLQDRGWKAEICAPEDCITSMHGLKIQTDRPLNYANEADVVLFGSGIHSFEQRQSGVLDVLTLNPDYQLIGAQCSGALFLDALGLLPKQPISTDVKTRGVLETRGVTISDKALSVAGNIATAGGCLSSVYLAAWVIATLADAETMKRVMTRVAPVGELEGLLEKLDSLLVEPNISVV